jgi:hypothetical protein
MFQYVVLVEFTGQLKGDFEVAAREVARYGFDLGLQENEMIKLESISLFGEDPVSYVGTVKKKEKFIEQDHRRERNHIFGIYVWIEVADKENFEKVREFMRENDL